MYRIWNLRCCPINRHIVFKFCGTDDRRIVMFCWNNSANGQMSFSRFEFMPDSLCTNLGTTSPDNLMCVNLYRVEPPLIRVNCAKNATVNNLITCVARPSAWIYTRKIWSFLASMQDPWFQLLVKLCRNVMRCKYDTLVLCCSGIRIFTLRYWNVCCW